MVLVPSAYHLISEQFASPLPVSVISPDPHRSPATNIGAVASHAQFGLVSIKLISQPPDEMAVISTSVPTGMPLIV